MHPASIHQILSTIRLATLGLSLVFFSACQTNMLKQFDQMKPGMDKHDAVEILGSPTTKTRLHGKDRWIYAFYENNIRYNKELHFSEGLIVYAGDEWKPEKENSAESRDKKNEANNIQLETEERQSKENAKKSYAEYEKHLRRDQEKVLYLPQFVPVQ